MRKIYYLPLRVLFTSHKACRLVCLFVSNLMAMGEKTPLYHHHSRTLNMCNLVYAVDVFDVLHNGAQLVERVYR